MAESETPKLSFAGIFNTLNVQEKEFTSSAPLSFSSLNSAVQYTFNKLREEFERIRQNEIVHLQQDKRKVDDGYTEPSIPELMDAISAVSGTDAAIIHISKSTTEERWSVAVKLHGTEISVNAYGSKLQLALIALLINIESKHDDLARLYNNRLAETCQVLRDMRNRHLKKL